MSNYYFKDVSYDSLLDTLASTATINSCETSTLPLVDFWKPKNKALPQFIKLLENKIGNGFIFDCAAKFFEYPTPPIINGKPVPHSKPSMTDLMILGNHRVAIEAKYTEYVNGGINTIDKWLKDHSDNSKKPDVLAAWFQYIQNYSVPSASCNSIVDYQFLHRTASACYNTQLPVLIYQIFYDKTSTIHCDKKDQFVQNLEDYANELHFNSNIKFLVIEVPIINADDILKKYKGITTQLFTLMKAKTVYNFDWDNILIKEYDSLKSALQ